MNAIEKLKVEAREKRDAAIKTAKLEYRITMQLIRDTAKKLRGQQYKTRLYRPIRPRNPEDGPLAGYTAVAAAEVVLQERGPLTLIEIAAEIQARGCRPGDSP